MIESLVFWGKCKKCGHEFKFPSDPYDYGIRFLRSMKSLQPAKVICEDPFFKEIAEVVKQLSQNEKLSEVEIADKFDLIFGNLCDKAPDSSFYDMSGSVYCPSCQSSDAAYGPTDPPEYIWIDPPLVTHSEWDKLINSEKKKKIKKLLEDLYPIKKEI